MCRAAPESSVGRRGVAMLFKPRYRLHLFAGALAVVFLILNLWWIGADKLVRDGDEEGHVGQAELIVEQLNQGRFAGAIDLAFVSDDMGDYPSFYHSNVALWWWLNDGGHPSRLSVRSFNLLYLVLAAGAIYWMRGRVPTGPALLGASTVLFLPLSVGIARHFMPEGALAACVALAIAAAVRQRNHPSPRSALLLGLALGAGFLTKQTFPLYVIAPLAYLIRPHRSLLWCLPGLLLVLPWATNNLFDQGGYLGASASYQGDAGWWGHLRFYPTALWSLGLGPVWCLLFLAAIRFGWSSRHRDTVILGLVWLLGGMLVLSFVPKKYARLLVPLLPACGLIFAAALSARPRFAPFLLMGVAWTTTASISPKAHTAPSASLVAFEPGEIQVWFRAPVRQDLGFSTLRDMVKSHPNKPVYVSNAPSLTDHQTTHPWDAHLGPWLRRDGLDRELFTDLNQVPNGPYLWINFPSSGPVPDGTYRVPLLDQPFQVSIENKP